AKWSDAQPQMMFSSTCRVHRAEIMQFGGAWNDALREIENLPIISARKSRIDIGAAAYQEGEIHRARGEYSAAEIAYARAGEAGGDTQRGLARRRLAQGRLDDAAGGIRRALTTTAEPLKRARYLPGAVEILLVAGARDEAVDACRELAAAAAKYA